MTNGPRPDPGAWVFPSHYHYPDRSFGAASLIRPLAAQGPVQMKATVYAGKICKWPTRGAEERGASAMSPGPSYNVALTGGLLHQRTRAEEARSSVSHTAVSR